MPAWNWRWALLLVLVSGLIHGAHSNMDCDNGQYCSYAPSQLYYASYYTGIYSTYYTNYYSDYVLSFYSDRKKRAGPSEGFV